MSACRFIREHTKLLPVPLVPEIKLHLAEESLAVWQKTEEELGDINVPPPYWAFAWAGGQALARYVLDHASLVRGRRVLDLGAGSGLVGIAAAMAGAGSVSCADTDAFAIAAVKLNARANSVALTGTREDLLTNASGASWDLCLIGDLFYERSLAERVLSYAQKARRDAAGVLVGDPMRSYFPRELFEQIAGYQVPVTRDLEDAAIKQTAVWRLI